MGPLRQYLSLVVSGALLLFTLAGCGTVKINSPASSTTPIPSLVTIDVSWNDDMQPGTRLEVFLDNVDISNQFTNYVGRRAVIQYGMTPGCHALSAYAHLKCLYCTPTPWARVGQTVNFQVQGAQLAFAPANLTLDAGAGVSGTVSVPVFPAAPLPVTLTPSNANFRIDNAAAGQPATVTINPPQTSATFTVTGVSAGSGNIAASNPCAPGAQMSVAVRPVLTGVTPNTGPPGTAVALSGQGFATPMRANFGASGSNASNVSATSASATVPNANAGTVNLTVSANGQVSASGVPFIVTATPVPPPATPVLVLRTSSNDVQSFDVANATTPRLIATRSATPSAGGYAGLVGLALAGPTRLIRAGSTSMEVFPVDAAGNIQPVASMLAVAGTATSVAVTASGNRVVRGTELGIQLFSLSGNTLTAGAFGNGNASATGTAVAINGNTVVRAVADGIEVWDITTLANPVRRGMIAQGGVSATGVDVKINVAGTRAVRAFSGGIDVYDISTPTNPRLVTSNFNGGLSATKSTLVLVAGETRALRAYDGGIEVYDLTSPTLQKLGSASGDPSAAGAAVIMTASGAVRSGASSIEVFDVSNPAAIMRRGGISATLSPTGVGLAN